MRGKELVKAVLNHLRQKKPVTLSSGEKIGFHMESTLSSRTVDKTDHNCRTVGCIAGWAIALSGECATLVGLKAMAATEFDGGINQLEDVFDCAARLLELPYEQAYSLFMGLDINPSFDRITPEMAADALEETARQCGVL